MELLNVGYINRHNFEFSVTFLEQLAAFYLQNNFLKKEKIKNFDIVRPVEINGRQCII